MKFSLNRILILIILFLALVIGIVTGVAFATKKAAPGTELRTIDPEPTPKEIKNLNKYSSNQLAAYTGIGRIRTITLAEDDSDFGCAIVVTPWFTYQEENTELFEELSKKRILITGIISNYFSTKTKKQLLSTKEDKIKADLLTEINSQLVLGKIQQLFFTDYIFLE